MNNNKVSIIRIKYNNGSTIEELAKQFDTEIATVMLIVENKLYYSSEFEEGEYDMREDKCGICGSVIDEDGNPKNCAGDCGRETNLKCYEEYAETDDMPDELDFN